MQHNLEDVSLPPKGVLIRLITIGLTMSIFSLLIALLSHGQNWVNQFALNFGTEMFGAAVSFYFINLILGEQEKRREELRELRRQSDAIEREKRWQHEIAERERRWQQEAIERSERWQREINQQQEQAYKNSLMTDMGSPNNTTALDAIRKLEQKGWLIDGSLRGINLRYCNLQRAFLKGANLQGANLQHAQLTHANFDNAKLESVQMNRAELTSALLNGVNLRYALLEYATLVKAAFVFAELQEADLRFANLSGAYLEKADLTRSNLYQARLLGANLRDAKLTGANVQGVLFDEMTKLPDGTSPRSIDDFKRFGAVTIPVEFPR
jgi:hypothetical protein